MTYAGCEKLKIAAEDCQLVMEEDGTEIDEDVDVIEFAGSTFILLGKDQCWSNALSVTPTSPSVPETNKPVAASSSEDSQAAAASTNTSKTF